MAKQTSKELFSKNPDKSQKRGKSHAESSLSQRSGSKVSKDVIRRSSDKNSDALRRLVDR